MKKTVSREIIVCDVCHADCGYPRVCEECGTEMCRQCADAHGKTYPHGVYCCGSGDGFYCAKCDSVLTMRGTDRRHNACRAVERLRMEGEAWEADYRRRCAVAEAAMKETK